MLLCHETSIHISRNVIVLCPAQLIAASLRISRGSLPSSNGRVLPFGQVPPDRAPVSGGRAARAFPPGDLARDHLKGCLCRPRHCSGQLEWTCPYPQRFYGSFGTGGMEIVLDSWYSPLVQLNFRRGGKIRRILGSLGITVRILPGPSSFACFASYTVRRSRPSGRTR